jgi:hypothetical protein
LGVENALAFDAEDLSTLNTVDLLSKVTQSVVIQGFNFAEALEHTLKESFKLGRHTNVFHFSSDHVTQYLWAHKDYQPWGKKLPLQCPQYGILQPWRQVHLKNTGGYGMECKNMDCGKLNRRECYSFQVLKPEGSSFFNVGKNGGWLKLTVD